jgi:FkbM family methyltransferase
MPPLRSVLTTARGERVTSVVAQASTVHASPAFVLRELSARRSVVRYSLRESGRPIIIRHNTADGIVLGEVFYSGHYELPDPVAARLESLGRPPAILDLGANIGLFGVFILERYRNAQITAFEPDPANAAILRRCIEANNATETWRLIEAAATDRDGHVPFVAGQFSRSRIEASADSVAVEAMDVFPHLEAADFAKIDIEGGEWTILRDPRFATLGTEALVLEYHADQCPAADARAAAFDALEGAGYETLPDWQIGNTQGMLWAWKRGPSEAAGTAG